MVAKSFSLNSPCAGRFHGYCNAFRYDVDRRKGQTSVGLGSNVAKSFVEIERCLAQLRFLPPLCCFQFLSDFGLQTFSAHSFMSKPPSPFPAIHDWHIWLILPLFSGLDLSKDLLRLHKGQTACQREPAMRQWFHLFTSPTRMMLAMVSWHMGQPGYLPASAVCKYISATQGVDNLRSLYSEADS